MSPHFTDATGSDFLNHGTRGLLDLAPMTGRQSDPPTGAPRAPGRITIPSIEIHHMESPTPMNPLGVKGAAESGTIGAPAAIVSAIEDALAPLDIVIRDLPVTPARLRALIAAAEATVRKR